MPLWSAVKPGRIPGTCKQIGYAGSGTLALPGILISSLSNGAGKSCTTFWTSNSTWICHGGHDDSTEGQDAVPERSQQLRVVPGVHKRRSHTGTTGETGNMQAHSAGSGADAQRSGRSYL